MDDGLPGVAARQKRRDEKDAALRADRLVAGCNEAAAQAQAAYDIEVTGWLKKLKNGTRTVEDDIALGLAKAKMQAERAVRHFAKSGLI